ncbi:YfbK domain-containing protein [Haloferula sargassicola]|uniref:VWFA domain-containing protein n=1 Tax=Haloferula sargassicola TaxID=490096 RepID=A0ABP9USF7_9BACT
MSDHDKPLEALGDEALEARVVAWVLGEATDFDAEELQQRCDREPELALFAKRVREVHGLIGESRQPAGEEWRLSEARRRKVTDLLGVDPPQRKTSAPWRKAVLALAACVLAALIASPLFMRKVSVTREAPVIASYSAPASPKPSEPALEQPRVAGRPMVETRSVSRYSTLNDDSAWDEKEISSPSDITLDMKPAPALATPEELPALGQLFRKQEVGKSPAMADVLGRANRADDHVESTPAGMAGGSFGVASDAGLGNPLLEGFQQPDVATYGGYQYSRGLESSPEVIDDLGLAGVELGEQAKDEHDIRKDLYQAQSYYDLGQLEEANQAYEKVLEKDRYNTAARRGMEQVNAAKSSYDRAAYDQTRAELLAEVDKAWQLDLPADKPNQLDEIHDRVVALEDLVEEKRQALTRLTRTETIPYVPNQSGVDDARGAAERYANLEAEKIRLQSQIETLLRSDGDQLMTYASGLNVPENVVRTLYPKYLEARRALNALEVTGLGENHPGYKQQKEIVDQLETQVTEGVTALREVLRTELDTVRKQTRRHKEAAETTGEAGIARKGFDEARREFEEAREALEALQAQQIQIEHESRNKPDPAVAFRVLDLMKETPAGEEPYSTFSLNVSDASFKLAAAAIERGEVPAPESIRPEEFYNAFDYGDPSPATGEPVACAIEQAAHLVFPQRNLLRIGVKTGSEGRLPTSPLNLTVLIDNSGSMERPDRQLGVQQAVASLASLLKAGDTVTLASFARQPRLLADRIDGADAAKLNEAVLQTPSEGGTNLEEALKLGEEFSVRQFSPQAQNRLVLFTDGAANLGDADPESLQKIVENLRQQGIAFDAAGFGADGLNDRLLERLSRDGNGRYTVIDDPAEAGPEFARQLAGAFRPAAENVKVQVKFNPARVGRYKLIGFDEHRLKQEDFRNDAVDAAEMAAEEAGVALYQVEVLPEGSGEVGEVSVRFRDAADGSMVERSWTIPYDPQAPAFDQAPASLRLAGVSAMLAEKLRQAPMAEAIDLEPLRAVLAGVSEDFDKSGRVAQLARMLAAE